MNFYPLIQLLWFVEQRWLFFLIWNQENLTINGGEFNLKILLYS